MCRVDRPDPRHKRVVQGHGRTVFKPQYAAITELDTTLEAVDLDALRYLQRWLGAKMERVGAPTRIMGDVDRVLVKVAERVAAEVVRRLSAPDQTDLELIPRPREVSMPEGFSIRAVARIAGMPKSTVHRLLRTVP